MNRILIVDDDTTLVDFLKLLLESGGYETADAADGDAALRKIAEFNPEIVLLDYMMPNMDGLHVLRHVTEHCPASFVVMLTGKGSEEVAVECMKAGAVDYVLKPFENEKLLSVIQNALRFRESELQKRKMISDLQDLADRLEEIVSNAPENQIEQLKTLVSNAQERLKHL
jgi:DNA-binding response OmpR family regulator